MSSGQELKQRLEAYLTEHIPGMKSLVIERLEQIHGGWSRETHYLGFRYRTEGEHSERTILRMLPESGGFTSAGMMKEVEIFEALRDTKIPAPRMLFWSDDKKWLGSSFVIMKEVEGCESLPMGSFQGADIKLRKQIGTNFWTMLGELAKVDPVAVGLIEPDAVPALKDVWRFEWDHVKNYHQLGGSFNNPLFEMLMRWLEQNPPPPAAKLSVVHGDYRLGNILYNPAGEIPLLMDWELWRLGDPVADLVYSISAPVGLDKEGNACGLIPVAEAIAIWEKNTGIKVPPQSSKWYDAAQQAYILGINARMFNEYFASGGREAGPYFSQFKIVAKLIPGLRQLLNLPAPTVKRPPTPRSGKGERISDYLHLAAKRYSKVYQQDVTDEHTRKNMTLDALIFNAIADRIENGIFYFAEDNTELEAVLHLAVKTFATGALLERLNLLLSEKAASLCLSDQAERNEHLRAALIAVHSAVEREQTPAAKRLEADIRQTISNQCERFSIPEAVLMGLG